MPADLQDDYSATDDQSRQFLSAGQCATLACLVEVSVPKPGNVHRGADFSDTTFYDFAISAVAIAQPMEAARQTKLGVTIVESARATRRLVRSNTNLGIILLLAPLATVTRYRVEDITRCIEATDANDCDQVYQAIRMYRPAGLGKVGQHDIAGPPPQHLLQAMTIAAEHDLIARQYACGFRDVLEFVVPSLLAGQSQGLALVDLVIDTHLRIMSEFPDSLIARKAGRQVAEQSAAMAQQVLKAGQPGSQDYLTAVGDLDFWLRQDGNRRNPGTTADLITAGLFVALRSGLLLPPLTT